ncbi:MAG: hypothetical protein H6816_02655 [Phycisphaerales bacterium]|nr:hypothetical protein [Phycisphaerales bacterium]
MRRKLLIAVGLALNVAVIGGFLALVERMAPYQPGNAEDFWHVALGVDLSPRAKEDRMWGHVSVQDDWFFYESQHLHGATLYRVSESEALARFPAVLDILDVQSFDPARQKDAARAYRTWILARDESTRGLQTLLEQVADERAERVPDASVGWAYGEIALQERIFKLHFLPAGLVFEMLYLGALPWFVLVPCIRRRSRWRVALRVALVPLLFFLPAYLGYCRWTFTSIGPSGGVLYPWLLHYVTGGKMFRVEGVVLDWVPQFLEPISQDFGCPMIYSGWGMRGPTVLLSYGAVAAAFTLVVPWLWRRWQRRRRALDGFLMGTP